MPTTSAWGCPYLKKLLLLKKTRLRWREQGFSKILWQPFPKPCRKEWDSISSSSQKEKPKHWAGRGLAQGLQMGHGEFFNSGRETPLVSRVISSCLSHTTDFLLKLPHSWGCSSCVSQCGPAISLIPWPCVQGAAAQPQSPLWTPAYPKPVPKPIWAEGMLKVQPNTASLVSS